MANPDGKIKAANDAGLSKTGMAVVPVKVWIKGSKTPTVTYAFLDSGSSSTFCTETLMRQLGVSGPKTTISLRTLEKRDSLVDSFVVTDLTISDLGENVFIKLPTLYTRPSIRVSGEDIPTQDDVDKWPHLSGVHLPSVDAEIGLLIASDVPEVLDPLEVKHSQDGGPYASRTSVGWAVNGPLSRHRRGSRGASFFIKADIELHQMVQDFYNRDFSESIADNKTDLSSTLAEYQMSVHLFGAVSSPACANFALRKTADDNDRHFSSDVTSTIKRNFYVDDCLKSLPSDKDAIAHVNELCSLLQRGGFRLTKWISSSREVLESIPVAGARTRDQEARPSNG